MTFGSGINSASSTGGWLAIDWNCGRELENQSKPFEQPLLTVRNNVGMKNEIEMKCFIRLLPNLVFYLNGENGIT